LDQDEEHQGTFQKPITFCPTQGEGTDALQARRGSKATGLTAVVNKVTRQLIVGQRIHQMETITTNLAILKVMVVAATPTNAMDANKLVI
jgi:hypothetical protein